VCIVCVHCMVVVQLQSSWQQLQSNQSDVGSQIQCLTEEMSVMQTAKDQVGFCAVCLLLHQFVSNIVD